ncbi:MAG: FecR domain-containing protein [Candidatus Marinimicrobia bacterium]|nr:FecR domain-containing protein [Candidatus Neomarinimicrobiota bacterium]MBL7030351.1 FecR domain-containing protein [Candidatus Neomarinimicrobiota bacterium]
MQLIRKISLCLFFLSLVLGGDKIAVATKVIGSVSYTRGKAGPKILKKGHIFESGDFLKTDKGSFAALIFIDDKSALKIKENTELVIAGKRSAKAIAKEINLDGGIIRAQVNKQQRGDFIIRTSVSVASVKGTDFWLISDKKTGDSVIGIDGVVTLMNQLSGESIDITSGITGFSSQDGGIQSFTTDPKTIPEDPTATEGDDKKLEIEFKDASGKKKTLIIKYK